MWYNVWKLIGHRVGRNIDCFMRRSTIELHRETNRDRDFNTTLYRGAGLYVVPVFITSLFNVIVSILVQMFSDKHEYSLCLLGHCVF